MLSLTPEQARFLLDCVSFSRDAGVLKAVPNYEHLGYEVAEILAPVARGGA